MAVKKVYVVAPKVTILINGITYKSGSVIKPEYFADKAVWTKFIQKKRSSQKKSMKSSQAKFLLWQLKLLLLRMSLSLKQRVMVLKQQSTHHQKMLKRSRK